MKNFKYWSISFLIVFLLVVLIFEGGSYSYLRISGRIPSVGYAEIYRKTLTADSQNYVSVLYDNLNLDLGSRYSHPYFGYTPKDGIFESANPFDLPFDHDYTKNENEFNVGIFGGSVAGDFYNHILKVKNLKMFISSLREIYPETKNRSIKVFNFAQGSAKQPQQFIISSFYVEFLDLTINLDGLNEVDTNRYPHVPLELPLDVEFLFPRFQDDSIVLFTYYRQYWKKKIFLARKGAEWKILGACSAYFFLYQMYLQKARKVMEVLSKMLTVPKDGSRYNRKIYKKELSSEAEGELQVAIWQKYTKLQKTVLDSYNVKNFYFLQPILIYRDSKHLSEREKRLPDLAYEDWTRKINFKYGLLKEMVKKLKNQKVRIFDLTDVFKNNRETLFDKDITHFNDHGHSILARSILDAIRSTRKNKD